MLNWYLWEVFPLLNRNTGRVGWGVGGEKVGEGLGGEKGRETEVRI